MKGICPQCGAPHKEDDERCAYCGYYFPKKKTEDNNNGNTYGQYTGGTDNHKGLWIAMAVGVLFLGLVGIAISSSSGRSSVGSRPVSNMPPVRGYQATEDEEETESKDEVKSSGGRLTSAYYRQFAELVFKKPSDEITGEELSQIKVIQAVRDGIYYSFSDPNEEGYVGTVQSMALESRDQNERDLLQFQGLVKLEVEQLTRPGDLSRLPELRSLTVAGLVLRIAALGIYILGIAAAVLIPKYTKINMHLLSLGLDGAVLVLLGFLPKEVNPFLALYPVFFVMALQWCAFKGAGGYVSSTIFSTNNLRQMTTALTEYLCDRKEEQLHKAGFFGKTLLFYHIGVGICFLATGPMGVKSAWICLLPVAAAAVQAAEECPVRESALADSLL